MVRGGCLSQMCGWVGASCVQQAARPPSLPPRQRMKLPKQYKKRQVPPPPPPPHPPRLGGGLWSVMLIKYFFSLDSGVNVFFTLLSNPR